MKFYYGCFALFFLSLWANQVFAQAEILNPTNGIYWRIKGNAAIDTSIHFVGTTDNKGLTFRTNNIRRMTVNTDGNIGIGTVIPSTLFQISGAHTTTQFRMSLPAALNGGGTGDADLQLWISEPCVTWEGAGIGVNVNNTYAGGAGCAGGVPMPKLNAGIGQAFIRFETNGGVMRFYTIANATAPAALALRERMSISSIGVVTVNNLAGTVNRPLFIDPTGALRSSSGGNYTATSGYALCDGTAWSTFEGTVRVLISGNILLVRAYDEANALQQTYTLNNVYNAKVVVLIVNDDAANCGGNVKISRPLIFTRINGQAEQSISSDQTCNNSDGHTQLIQIYYNPQ